MLPEDARVAWFRVHAVNHESIHNHDAFAQVEWPHSSERTSLDRSHRSEHDQGFHGANGATQFSSCDGRSTWLPAAKRATHASTPGGPCQVAIASAGRSAAIGARLVTEGCGDRPAGSSPLPRGRTVPDRPAGTVLTRRDVTGSQPRTSGGEKWWPCLPVCPDDRPGRVRKVGGPVCPPSRRNRPPPHPDWQVCPDVIISVNH